MSGGDQLRAAHRLYQEALGSGAVAPEPLGSRLLALGELPPHETLLAWAHDFRDALGTPPVQSADLVGCAVSFGLELSSKAVEAVMVLGELLSAQGHLTPAELGEAAEELEREPTADALRTVLMTWINRGASWGGPIVGWMRDLRDRLEPPG